MNAPHPIRSPLDELYADRADTRPAMLYPVYGREGTLAWFLDYYAAVDFVNANLGTRNLFIGEPEYRRDA